MQKCQPTNKLFDSATSHHKPPGMNDVTEQIIGCAFKVLNQLKPGLDEKIYERALCIELTKSKLQFESQARFDVQYDWQLIGTLVPDLIVEEKVIVETKIASAFNETHLAQALGYLNITGMPLAILLNFKHATLGIKRVRAATAE